MHLLESICGASCCRHLESTSQKVLYWGIVLTDVAAAVDAAVVAVAVGRVAAEDYNRETRPEERGGAPLLSLRPRRAIIIRLVVVQKRGF